MKTPNMFFKVVIPIVAIGILLAFLSINYLNSFVEENINHEISQKVQFQTNSIDENIKSEFKLFKNNFMKQNRAIHLELLSQWKDIFANSEDILYISSKGKKIAFFSKKVSFDKFKESPYLTKNRVEIANHQYEIGRFYFKPWDWDVVCLVDITSFNTILYKNKMTILMVVSFMLVALMLLLGVVLKLNVKRPIDMLLKHFSAISKGNYLTITTRYSIKEIDDLIADVNEMTNKIKSRISLAKQNEDYVKDILNSQNSIIIINDSKKTIGVNESFFKFFDEYATVDEFQKDHDCICDYFEKEDGFVYKFDDKNWVEYILNVPNVLHKVKIKKDKKYYFFVINAIKSKKYDRVIITMTDITKLEQINTLLEQYKKAVDASAIVSKTDPFGRITYANDKFVSISGYTTEELIGKNHNIVRHPSVPKETFADLWKTILSKKIWHGVIENKKKNGESYFVNATVVPILDENNKIVEFIALRYDITEQVLAIQKANQAEKTKGLFLANMSHEIRTPLNAIIGFTSILKRSKLDKKEANYIDIIDKSAENLLGIVNDILDISKIENGELVCEKIEFNPYKEFNAVVDLFLAKANEKGINLISYIDPRILQKIIGDPLRIKQVISNLISNAIKFSFENSEIFVEIKLVSQSEKSCRISFSVKDGGIGISKDKQKTIFEEFKQADESTSREFGGTGLGLSISNKIVQILGSQINIESKEGEGARFFFELEYETVEFENKNLTELSKLNIAILESNDIESYDHLHLKTYLQNLVNLQLYKNISEIECEKLDILIVDEKNITDDVIQIDKRDSLKIMVLAKEMSRCDKLKNCIVLNVPFNTSIIFDILVGFVDQDQSSVEPSSGYMQFSGKILIAEDHEINRELVSTLLDLRGIEHIFALNGQEVVELFKKGSYDLIFMDINMPVKNGKEATKEILEIENQKGLKHIPIVALSANVIEADTTKTMQIGFDDYLFKPIDEMMLDKVLIKYLDRKKVGTKKDGTLDLPLEKKSVEILKYELSDLASKIGLPEAVVTKIAGNFAKMIDEDLKNLKGAIDEVDFENIKGFAHKIKGASLNLRLDDIAKYATSLEKKGDVQDDAGLKDDFDALVEAVKFFQSLFD